MSIDDTATYADVPGIGKVSRAAYQLHGFAALNSIEEGHPGFVSTDYLDAITAETTSAVLELELTGLWTRCPDGYQVVHDLGLRLMIDAGERQTHLTADCQNRGCHLLPSSYSPGDDWVTCDHCGVLLVRPDVGPVAPEDGGPLHSLL